MTTETKVVLKGGEWLIKDSDTADSFSPEDFSDEQKMIRDMCSQYLKSEVIPLLDRIDNLEPGLMRSLVQKAGEQGMLSVSFPEEYGGLGKDFVTSTIINDYLGPDIRFLLLFQHIQELELFLFYTLALKNKNKNIFLS
jgi:alkylation response protein AidB-like acyl-CoA dehydrogenase